MRTLLLPAVAVIAIMTLCADPAAAIEHEDRWKNPFSLDYQAAIGDSGTLGIRGTWFPWKYVGFGASFMGLSENHTGSLFVTARFMYRGLYFGIAAGPQYGQVALKERGGDEDIPYTSKGLFVDISPYVGYWTTNGLHVGVALHKFFGLSTTESIPGATANGTTVSLFGGIHFAGFGEIFGSGSGGSLLNFMKWEDVGTLVNTKGYTNAADTFKGWEKRFAWAVGAGPGTPMGHIFAELSYAIAPELELSIGGGKSTEGAAAAAMLRYRSISTWDGFFLFLGSGLSWQPLGETLFRQHHTQDDEEFLIKNAYFFNIEIGMGSRSDTGFTYRIYVGLTTLLNPQSGECVKNCVHTSAGGTEVYTSEEGVFNRVYPYLGITIGPSF